MLFLRRADGGGKGHALLRAPILAVQTQVKQPVSIYIALKIDDGEAAEDIPATRHGLRRGIAMGAARHLLADVGRLAGFSFAQHIVDRAFLALDVLLDMKLM